MLSIAGTAAGLLLARWATGCSSARSTSSIDMPLNLDFHFDWRVFRTPPRWRASPACSWASCRRYARRARTSRRCCTTAGRRLRRRRPPAPAQRAGRRASRRFAGPPHRRRPLRAQPAAGAVVDLGFDAAERHDRASRSASDRLRRARTIAFYDELDRRLAGLPGVESVGMAFSVPMGYILDGAPVAKEGDILATEEPRATSAATRSRRRYFDTLRIPIVRGRGFTTQDTETSTLVVDRQRNARPADVARRGSDRQAAAHSARRTPSGRSSASRATASTSRCSRSSCRTSISRSSRRRSSCACMHVRSAAPPESLGCWWSARFTRSTPTCRSPTLDRCARSSRGAWAS